jgi:glycosyltransferase involved in cell wall biosynthesis
VQHHFLPYQWLKLLRRNSIPDRLVNYPVFSWRLSRQLRTISPAPQLVHAHGLAALGYAINSIEGIPLVLNPHGMEEFKQVSILKQLAYTPFRVGMRYAAQRSAAVIATDQALVAEASRFLQVSPRQVWLVPNAIDLEAFDQKLSLAQAPAGLMKASKPSLLMLSVGRIEENKGLGVGLVALKSLEAGLPAKWRWVVVGEGSCKERLKAQVCQLGLDRNVMFVGALGEGELYGLYRQADLLIQPTLFEGSSLVTLEALAARLPVVASATGGIVNKVFEEGPNENGRLARPGDPISFAGKLAEVIQLSSEQRYRMGQNGRRLVEQRFSWKAVGLATLELYQTLCQKPGYSGLVAEYKKDEADISAWHRL